MTERGLASHPYSHCSRQAPVVLARRYVAPAAGAFFIATAIAKQRSQHDDVSSKQHCSASPKSH
jgi:hypothetical protein